MSADHHAATKAAMKEAGCTPIPGGQGPPSPDIWVECSAHRTLWDLDRDECSTLTSAVRIGYEAGRRDASHFRSLPEGMVWQDYFSPDEVLKYREEARRDALNEAADKTEGESDRVAAPVISHQAGCLCLDCIVAECLSVAAERIRSLASTPTQGADNRLKAENEQLHAELRHYRDGRPRLDGTVQP